MLQKIKVRFITIAVYILIIGLVIVSALVTADFKDPDWAEIGSKIAIMTAITISLLFLAIKDGEQLYRYQEGSRFLIAFKDFSTRVWAVVKKGVAFAFRQYTHEKYLDRLHAFYEQKIGSVGLQDARILDLSYEEILTLHTRPLLLNESTDDEYGFDVLTDEQYVTLLDIKDGKFRYDEIPSDWFLTHSTASTTSDVYQYYAHVAQKRKQLVASKFIYKILMLILLSILAGFLDMNKLDGDPASIIFAILLRLLTAGMSIASGYMTAKDLVHNETEELNYKITFIDEFFSDYTSGVFIPTNITDDIKVKLQELDKIEIDLTDST